MTHAGRERRFCKARAKIGPVTRPLLLAVLTAGVSAGAAAHAQTPPAAELRSLHLRQTVWGGDEFVFVEPIGPDVRVRAVRVAHVNDHCPSLLVQAAETIVRGTTVQAVAKASLCSMTQARIDQAHAQAPRLDTVDAFGGVEAVVAACGVGADREFVAPREFRDRDALARQSPDVADLWLILPRLRALVLDSSDTTRFGRAPADVAARRAALGTTLVPELLKGRYGAYLRPILAGYDGPPVGRGPQFVELVDADTLALTTYTPPVMPRIAINARVFGDVRLRLAVDSVHGSVTDVAVVSGPPLLREAAATAAKGWRFAPGARTSREVEATVRFRLRCD